MSKSRFYRDPRNAVIVVALLGAAALGTAWQRNGAIGDEPKKDVNPTAVRRAEELSEAFHNAAEIGMPSVVTIRSKVKARALTKSRPNRPRGDNPFKGTPFEDFFGRSFEDFNGQQMPRQGMGSGVIIDRSGIVLTNNHVVEGADEVVVRLADGREFKGEDIKTDDQTDLAVIRIKGAGSLPAATMGDSDKLRVGDWVIAIGNPFEYEQSVSAGIISGMGRDLGHASAMRRVKYLQTDAAINPGNSGGPLVNLNGEVIGINTAIATNNGSFAGLGFAIPINQAKWVTTQLIDKGSVQRAYLGVKLGDMSLDLADKLGAHRGEGVLIEEVMPNTPAAAAGFEAQDVITKFAGQKIKDTRELQQLVERSPFDSKQPVEVLRDGRTITLHVTPKPLPKEFGVASQDGHGERAPAEDKSGFSADDLGIEVSELAADKAEELGFGGFSGALITDVSPSSPAAELGLRAGMLITKVDKKAVKNVEDFRAAIKGQTLKDGILLHVRTRTGNRIVLLKE